MDTRTGRFYENKEDIPAPRPPQEIDYITFEPGEEFEIKGHTFVVCRIKNDRVIIRSAKMPPTKREAKVEMQYWDQKRREAGL